jgi:hypothetical protein
LYALLLGAGSSGNNTVAEELWTKLAEDILFCDWLKGDDYAGTNKRFSLGVALLIYFTGFFVGNGVFFALFGFALLTIVLALVPNMIWLSSFLILYVNEAYTCLPGLFVGLGDDIMYFLSYNLLPKCSYFWGFMVTDPLYDNAHCYACDSGKRWATLNCKNDLGFHDFIDNLVFTIDQVFPDFWDWLRDTRTPLYLLYQLPFVNQRVDKFRAVDLSDPLTYSQYTGCNYIVTLFPQTQIGIFFLAFSFVILTPLLVLLVGVAGWLLRLLGYLIILLYYVLIDLVIIMDNMYPPLPSQQPQQEEEEGEELQPLPPQGNLSSTLQKDWHRFGNTVQKIKDNIFRDKKDK